MKRRRGLSVRLQLTLSYAGFLMLAGALLLAVVWVFLLRYVPPDAIVANGGIVPGRSDLIEAFAPRVSWALLFLLLFGLAGGWWLAGRMLRPLERITAATRLAETGSLSHRINLPGRADEFRELADAFDAMLARVEAQVAEQRRFAANASHELRTPLAITRALLDVAAQQPDYDRFELLGKLEEVNDRAIRLTEALLLLGRAERRAFTNEPVDLSLLAEEAVESLLPLAERAGVTLEASGTAARSRGSRDLLLQLAMNLVHNGIVHNTGGFVRITTGQKPGNVFLQVENSGPVVDPLKLATLTEPFQRGAGRTRDDHAGTGLGLAIVKSIVAAHEGELGIRARAGGGLLVTVSLAVAQPASLSQPLRQ